MQYPEYPLSSAPIGSVWRTIGGRSAIVVPRNADDTRYANRPIVLRDLANASLYYRFPNGGTNLIDTDYVWEYRFVECISSSSKYPTHATRRQV